MRRDVVASLTIGFILIGEALTDSHRPYWLTPEHSHRELPEGTTRHFSSRTAADSSLASGAGWADSHLPLV
jgi:hypothetical protein